MTKRRTVNQLIADAALKDCRFELQSVERTRTYSRQSIHEMPVRGEDSYLWRFETGEAGGVRAYVTIRTLNPGLFSFESDYGWNELRLYKAHVHDYHTLNTRM